MGGQKFQYDESGSTFVYFLLSFFGAHIDSSHILLLNQAEGRKLVLFIYKETLYKYHH